MRAGALVIAMGLLLASVARETFPAQSTTAESDTPVVAACFVQGESCLQPSLGGGGQFVISHKVLVRGCPGADLHLVRYVPAGGTSSEPLIATWCS